MTTTSMQIAHRQAAQSPHREMRQSLDTLTYLRRAARRAMLESLQLGRWSVARRIAEHLRTLEPWIAALSAELAVDARRRQMPSRGSTGAGRQHVR